MTLYQQQCVMVWQKSQQLAAEGNLGTTSFLALLPIIIALVGAECWVQVFLRLTIASDLIDVILFTALPSICSFACRNGRSQAGQQQQ